MRADAPWRRHADRYPYLRDTLAAWLNAFTPGWRSDTGRRDRGRVAGYFVWLLAESWLLRMSSTATN
ncbi:hypothetical protein [Streptomyces sp. NBC_01445]|uniref:hypothetical protein n=1 Tax=Streptomyces sp. NBC_01445 TaxID=2903869 RepID=UPI002DDA402D|nr:hypothetical protein [Streptomyces sp. NBC_01445]WSE11567.1 hypothetical protein OG574_51270 [Streptomyces sp. NBC_01445]